MGYMRAHHEGSRGHHPGFRAFLDTAGRITHIRIVSEGVQVLLEVEQS